MNPVKILTAIQTLDHEITAIDSEGNDLRSKIKSLNLEVSELDVDVEMESVTVNDFEKAIKEAEEGIRVNKEKIEKDEGRLNEIKNDKEFAALTREIENAKKAITVFEMEILSYTEKFEESAGPLKEKEEILNTKKEELATVEAEFSDKEKGLNERIDVKTTEKENFLGDLPSLASRHYTALRERRGANVVVPVIAEVCQGCFINIPPQTFIELQKETGEIITCPHCHRIIYSANDKELSGE